MLRSLRPSSPLGEIAALFNECVQPAALLLQPLLHHGAGSNGVVRIGEVDLNMILLHCFPWAVLQEAVAQQVIIRQPAEEKRFTVAWSIPRRRRSG